MIHCMIRVLLVLLFLNCNLVISVPFEEDEKDPSIWFIDHNYHESMFSMFKRINGSSFFKFKGEYGACLRLVAGNSNFALYVNF
jgi:hypothetical protein